MTNTLEYKSGIMVKPGQNPRITPEDVETVFKKREDIAEPLTASEIGDMLNCTRRTALNKLNQLEEAGTVKSKKVGGRAKVWWVRVDRDDIEGHTRGVEGTSQRREATKNVFYDIDLPGNGENLEQRRAAVREIYEYLKERGKGQRSDFKEVVDVESTGYASFNSFYTNCLNNGAVLANFPDIESPGEGGHVYRYVGD